MMLSELSCTEKNLYHMIFLICGIKQQDTLTDSDDRFVAPRGWVLVKMDKGRLKVKKGKDNGAL